MFSSMFETAAYHRAGLPPWHSPAGAASTPCGGYPMSTFDPAATSASHLQGPLAGQSTPGYPAGLGNHHNRYGVTAGPLYDGRTAVRDVLFGCGRFTDTPARVSSQTGVVTDVGVGLQSSSVTAFSPLSREGPVTSATDCPSARLTPATSVYGYTAGLTPTDDRYYTPSNGPTQASAFTATDAQPVTGCGGQLTTGAGFRSPPSLNLGFNPRRFMNDVIGE